MGKQIIKPRFVDGVMLDPTLSRVVVIRKLRPDWQAGLLNCVGGKIEPGEAPLAAMNREFREETSVSGLLWIPYCDMKLKLNDGELYCFYAIGNVDKAHTVLDEDVLILPVAEVMDRCDTLPSLRWLIQMARSFAFGETIEKFNIKET